MTTIRTQYVEPVMFICETNGEPVPTGHRMRATDFEAIKGPRSFRCSECNRIHTWTVETAWLGLRHRAVAA